METVRVPISECDIEEVFKPLVYEDSGIVSWIFETESGEEINIVFVKEDDNE